MPSRVKDLVGEHPESVTAVEGAELILTANHAVKVFDIRGARAVQARRAFRRQRTWATRQAALEAREIHEADRLVLIMRRLPLDRALEHQLSLRALTAHDVARLAEWIERISRDAPRSAAVMTTLRDETQRSLALQLEALRSEVPRPLRHRIEAVSERAREPLGAFLDEAVAARGVRLGHGDLRASNIFMLGDGPVAIDASSKLRGYRIPWVGQLGSLAADLHFATQPRLLQALEARAFGAVSQRALLSWYTLVKGLARWRVAATTPRPSRFDDAARAAGPVAVRGMLDDVERAVIAAASRASGRCSAL